MFKPTSQCLPVPHHLNPRQVVVPCPHLSNEEIDLALMHIIGERDSSTYLPVTQLGRRAAVEAYLRYEQIGSTEVSTAA